jgi:hypothetical protein
VIPAGWKLDHVHKCGAMRLVRLSDGAVTTALTEDETERPAWMLDCEGCGWLVRGVLLGSGPERACTRCGHINP